MQLNELKLQDCLEALSETYNPHLTRWDKEILARLTHAEKTALALMVFNHLERKE